MLGSRSKEKNNGKTSNGSLHTVNLISENTTIQGDISGNSDIRIDGILKGNISCSAKVVIGETGKVTGEVRCQNADVLGMVDGEVYVKEMLLIKGSARIKGDIHTSKIIIETGGVFNGSCNMNNEQEEIAGYEQKKPKIQEAEKPVG